MSFSTRSKNSTAIFLISLMLSVPLLGMTSSGPDPIHEVTGAENLYASPCIEGTYSSDGTRFWETLLDPTTNGTTHNVIPGVPLKFDDEGGPDGNYLAN